jgi:hypothetical protein
MPEQTLECEECRCQSDEESHGWFALLGYDPREEDEPIVGFYCPACALREFGLTSRRQAA